MSTLPGTFEDFKKVARDFHEAVPTMNEEELDNAWKAVGLAYLGMHEEQWNVSAAILLDMEGREYWKRVHELAQARGNDE